MVSSIFSDMCAPVVVPDSRPGKSVRALSTHITVEDRRALFLGDRYQSFYYPEVVEASARHVDVSSSNLNAQFADGTFLRSYLATLHALANRPIIVSEFYLAAKENRSGNLNSSSGFPIVTTQVERTAAAQRTLSGLARLPFVVGADWFQYSDEPTHGRDDGENYNFGLVDVSDRPYTELTAMFSAFYGREITSVRLGAGREPLASEPRVRVENSSGLGNHVANVAALEIPTELLGRGPLHAGEALKLDVTLLTHGRAYRIDWRGEFTFRE